MQIFTKEDCVMLVGDPDKLKRYVIGYKKKLDYTLPHPKWVEDEKATKLEVEWKENGKLIKDFFEQELLKKWTE